MYLAFVVAWVLIIRLGTGLDVRLSGSGSPYEGRVEVYHAGTWGSVCDDKWADVNCRVVCRQIKFSGGTMTHDADAYGTCTGPIHLDDVICDGDEADLGECQASGFGHNNCDHKEDVGCQCDPSPTQAAGTCEFGLHRITPFSEALPGVGRAEVYTGSDWRAICDDFWNDHAAAVFCTCLNYNDTQHFRAYWSSSLINMSPALSLAYDAVKCSLSDTLSVKNIWDCDTNPVSGTRCSAATEAAGVACTAVPHTPTPVAPSIELTCDGAVLGACFKSATYSMSQEYLSLYPACNQSTTADISDGVCYNIDMEKCYAADLEVDESSKTYCYDVSYTQFDTNAVTLLTDNVWSRRACCSVSKNGTANSPGFRPGLLEQQPPAVVTSQTNFSLDCFPDEDFSGPALAFPVNVTRGQEMYCRVSVDSWDEHLYLVVPSCSFMATPSGSPSFEFLHSKCPTTSHLGLSYFSFDGHSWGFKFSVPKFQGYSELYLSCDTYVCDTTFDDKPYCDRSCSDTSRRRRSLDDLGRLKRSLPDGDLRVANGPLVVNDAGFGPLLTVEPYVRILEIPYRESDVGPKQMAWFGDESEAQPNGGGLPHHKDVALFYNTWVAWEEAGQPGREDVLTSGVPRAVPRAVPAWMWLVITAVTWALQVT